MEAVAVEVVHLLVSPVHRYAGRPGDGSVPASGPEGPTDVEVRAGAGIVGDRYYGRPAHRSAAVTVLDVDGLERMADELGTGPLDPAAARRNVVLRGPAAHGVDLGTLRGATLVLDCGSGPVRLRGGRPARPCAWMDIAYGPGAHAAMRGRGGLRCEPLGSGRLSLGPATFWVEPAPG